MTFNNSLVTFTIKNRLSRNYTQSTILTNQQLTYYQLTKKKQNSYQHYKSKKNRLKIKTKKKNKKRSLIKTFFQIRTLCFFSIKGNGRRIHYWACVLSLYKRLNEMVFRPPIPAMPRYASVAGQLRLLDNKWAIAHATCPGISWFYVITYIILICVFIEAFLLCIWRLDKCLDY